MYNWYLKLHLSIICVSDICMIYIENCDSFILFVCSIFEGLVFENSSRHYLCVQYLKDWYLKMHQGIICVFETKRSSCCPLLSIGSFWQITNNNKWSFPKITNNFCLFETKRSSCCPLPSIWSFRHTRWNTFLASSFFSHLFH